jgi:hypothetical protein
VGFLPAISAKAAKIRTTIRSWRTHRWTQLSIEELAETFNPVLRGWIGYYGQFYKSKLASVLGQFDYALRRWARRKFKRLKAGPTRAAAWLRPVAQQKPDLFATEPSPSPEWLNDRSGMNREIHGPLRESPEVKSL